MAANGIGAQPKLAQSSYAAPKFAAQQQKPAADTFQRPSSPTAPQAQGAPQTHRPLVHGFAQVCLGILTVCLWPLRQLQDGLLWLAGREPKTQTQRRALAAAQSETATAQAQLASLQARVQSLRKREAALQARVGPAQETLTTLQAQTQSQQGKLDALVQHAQRARRQATQAQAQLQATKTEHQTLSTTHNTLRQESQVLQQTLDVTRTQLSQVETDLQSKQPLTREIDALRGTLEKSQGALRDVQAKRSSAQQSLQKLRTQGKHWEDKRDRLQIECDHLRASKQTLAAQVEAAKQDEQPLLQRLQGLRTQQSALEDSNAGLQSANATLREMNQTLRGANHTLRGTQEHLQTTNHALSHANGTMYAELNQFSAIYAHQMHTMQQAMQQFAASIAHLNGGLPYPFHQSMAAVTQLWQANLQEMSTRAHILSSALDELAETPASAVDPAAQAHLERASLSDTNAHAIQAANTLAPVVLGLKMFRLKQMNAETLQKLMGRVSDDTLASIEKALFADAPDDTGYFKKPAEKRLRADRVMLRTLLTALTQGLDTDSETLRNWQFDNKDLKKELRQASLNLHCDHYNTLCNQSPAFKDKLTQLSRLFFAVNEQLSDAELEALKNGAID